MMTNLEIIDFVIEKLNLQGEQSMIDGYYCGAYRSNLSESKCAVGWLIKDEFYTEEIENENVYTVYERFPEILEKSLGVDKLSDNTLNLLGGLQRLHDSASSWINDSTRPGKKIINPIKVDELKQAFEPI